MPSARRRLSNAEEGVTLTSESFSLKTIHRTRGEEILEVLNRDKELTILVDDATRRNVAQTVNDVQDVRSELALLAHGEKIELPKDVSSIVMSVLESLGKGSRVVISTTPRELRTTAAAEMLGISRPTLLKMVRDGEIPSYKVGAHHRFRLNDILEYRTRQQRIKRKKFLQMRDSLDELN
ncbi:helix-turn-helix domain-containing protein [Bifidobacterium sp. 82T24]|uniref:helix-turn-helix domain-containing protein n=1 Tax=Bifidobacterium pluvialisilvae TaxID=2834436 RepID=UPI001C588AB7|nr:helix-turn-helix domain-containing protein [Bifidobacterium pluvialisilvae]MBW3089023.1 helix-turn-helix domain-containing protein [Bifidobacterium pluvialisilvae]